VPYAKSTIALPAANRFSAEPSVAGLAVKMSPLNLTAHSDILLNNCKYGYQKRVSISLVTYKLTGGLGS